MRRRIAGVLATLVATALMTALAGRWTALNVLGWAVFFAGLFWPFWSGSGQQLGCGRNLT